MQQQTKSSRAADPAAVVLGYLNFSSGAYDPAAWRALSDLYAPFEPEAPQGIVERADTVVRVAAVLQDRLAALAAEEPAFRDSTQARAVLGIVFDRLLPAYRGFHADLLEHQPPGAIERPFFVMAAAQAVLATGGSWDEAAAGSELEAEVIRQAIAQLNDYVGWRPVAVLENGRLSEPYQIGRAHV